MTPLLLDTNTVSEIVSYRRPELRARLRAEYSRGIMVSAISYGETMYGLSYNLAATRIAEMARLFFAETTIVPFTSETAIRYGALRAEMRRIGKALQPLDMLIAAHALEAGATLVSNDRAFRHVPELEVEDWTEAGGYRPGARTTSTNIAGQSRISSRPMLPPSGLPAISPSRGEIGCHGRLRQPPTLQN